MTEGLERTLSLPPKSKARGEIRLGTVLYDTQKWPAGLSRGELLQNVAVFGRSGAGKTNFAFLLLEQLSSASRSSSSISTRT